MLPARWQAVREFFGLVMAPLLDAELGGAFLVENNGPDGRTWWQIKPRAVDLRASDPALHATRAVAAACRASAKDMDPGPEAQQGMAVYYVPSALIGHARRGVDVLATSAIVLDIDDKSVGGRAGCVAALSRIPAPSFVVTSGGGIQVGYVFNEAVVFERRDADQLQATVYAYLRAAKALGRIAGADDTHWPGHLFRAPGAFHLKDPHRPHLVTVELFPDRRFNLDDFSELAGCIDEMDLAHSADRLLAQLRGEEAPTRRRTVTPPVPTHGVVRLPRRVSAEMVQLLNVGIHVKYMRADGSLDRSRATCAAALSLLGAGKSVDETLGVLASSALRAAVDDRGGYGEAWLIGQVEKAASYLAGSGARR